MIIDLKEGGILPIFEVARFNNEPKPRKERKKDGWGGF